MGKLVEWIGTKITNRDMFAFFIGIVVASTAIRIAS